MNNIYLIGFMGAGKTTVGKELSERLGRKLLDTDQCIVEQEGMSIAEIFEKRGEKCFRDAETACIKSLGAEENCVISCGGGVVLREENVAAMKRTGVIVLIEASVEVILERVSRNSNRPLLEGKKNIADIQAMMDARLPHYRSAADIIVYSDEGSASRVAEDIVARIP